MDNNAQTFYQRVPSIKQLLALLPGTYNIETATPFTLLNLKYIKTDNSLSFNASRGRGK
jgi:hypothetical protein